MAPANLLGSLPLLRRQNRVQLMTGAPDDRIQLGLNFSSQQAQFTRLAVHDRVDAYLLLFR